MEYIQCESCHKKYGVNDKVRAAAGRNITCKACGESFEITIFETPNHQTEPDKSEQIEANNDREETAQHSEASEKPIKEASEEKTEKIVEEPAQPQVKSNTHRKKVLAKKFAPSAILGVAIIVLSFYFFYLDRHVDVGQSFVATQTPKPIIDIPKISPNSPTTKLETEAPVKTQKNQPRESLSDACKQVAARQWLSDFTMFHGVPSTDEYVRMLDEGNKNTALIRKRCGNNGIVQEILATAQDGEPPTWLAKHIKALTLQDEKAPHF